MSRSQMRDNQGSNAMRGTTFSRRDLLRAGGALTVGVAFAAPPKPAAAEPGGAGPEPTSWVDSAMPEVTHRMIETNGIGLHVAEQGEGPLVILCHGFPECWYSWRHQLGALAKAGFRAVAPDLRGYGRSDRPEEVEKYTILHDIGDIVGLVDALGAKQAVIAGHDIGAAIAWQAALLRPDRFRAVIALSPPFRPAGVSATRGRRRRSCRGTRMRCSTSSSFRHPRLRRRSGATCVARSVPSSTRSRATGRRPRAGGFAGRDGASEGCCLEPIRRPCRLGSRSPTSMFTSRNSRGADSAAPCLVAQHRSQLGAAGSLCRSGGDRSRALHRGRPRILSPPFSHRTSRSSRHWFQSSGRRSCWRVADIGPSRSVRRRSALP